MTETPPSPDAPDSDRSAFRAASLSGVRWTSLARLLAEGTAISSSVVLARLVPPGEFGRAAIALGFTTIALAIAWGGLGTPLIQMESVSDEMIEVATFLSVAIALTLTLLGVFVAAPYAIAPIFGGRVAYFFTLASPVLLLSGIGTVPNAVLQRRLEFRRLSQIEITSLVGGAATAIALAAAGLNGDAIVLGSVATAFVATVMTLLASPLRTPRWRRREARQVGGFGAYAGLSNVTGAIWLNVDYAILGARLSARAVGFYWRAYQIGVEYQGKISGIMLRLALPLYSRAGSVEEMGRLRGKMVRMHTIVLYPILTTLIALAPEAVPLIFGPAWEPAVFPTQVLAVAGMASAAVAGSAQLAFAVGKPKAVFYFLLAALLVYVGVLLFASGYGLRAVVISVAVYQVLFVAAQFNYLESRQAGIPRREIWAAIVPALGASVISLAAAYPVARALDAAGLGSVLVILLAGILALGVYAVALRVLFPAAWDEALDLARELIGRKRRKAVDVPVTGE